MRPEDAHGHWLQSTVAVTASGATKPLVLRLQLTNGSTLKHHQLQSMAACCHNVRLQPIETGD